MLYALGIFVLGLAVHVAAGQLSKPIRPHELVYLVDRSSEAIFCKILSLRETSIHKALFQTNDHFIRESLNIPVPGTKRSITDAWRLLAYDSAVLLSQYQTDCPDAALNLVHNYQGTPNFQPWNISPDLQQSQVPLSFQDKDEIMYLGLEPLPLEIFPLVISGPSSNRVDLVFFSDGYVMTEKEQFIQDTTRLAEDISANHTFYTVKPLMNFWAAFTPSNESGVGTGGQPKDTPFGLYRDGTELRGLYSSKPDAIHVACASLGHGCDYAIVIGNDPLYGGLGGSFTTITPSLANGALVLRHELGHSIIDVGEEYDGGYEYFGVNAAKTLSSVTWKRWLSDPVGETVRAERSVMPMQAYPWTLLNTSSSWSQTFLSSGLYSRYLVRFSISGAPEKEDLAVLFDGVNIGWTPRKDIGIDRWHYDIYGDTSLEEGMHEVQFILMNKEIEGQAQLCNVEILEFGNDSEFNSSALYYGAFPTFDSNNETSYRPTNEACLMRAVAVPNFCQVCLEGLWLSLLKRVDLIENVVASCTWHASSPGALIENGYWIRSLEVSLVPLAQYRQNAAIDGESYAISWSKNGEILVEFTNQTTIAVNDEIATYTVDVRFSTGEVREDRSGWLTATSQYQLMKTCSGL